MDAILLKTLEQVKQFTDAKLAEVQSGAEVDLTDTMQKLVVIITNGTRQSNEAQP